MRLVPGLELSTEELDREACDLVHPLILSEHTGKSGPMIKVGGRA